MMNRQDHARWLDRLSDHLEGNLPPEEAVELEAHLSECGPCRETLADLRRIVAEARALGPVPPARDLWPGIEGAIGAPVRRVQDPDVLAFPRTVTHGAVERSAGARGWMLTAPQLAAAAFVLVSLSAAATWWVGAGVAIREAAPPVAEAGPAASLASDAGAPPPELTDELATLESILAEARARLDPQTVRILDKNLGVIQRAIDESVRALAVDPDNAFVRSHLERAWREKADFLREASRISAWEG
jgi:hypothetical protein